MEQNKLISLALSFSSFVIERIDTKSIILFGSVAANTYDEESDIDIFIETSIKNEDKIKKILELYKKTNEYEKFKLSGILNEISIKCGSVDKWKDLKRSIIANGIILYGRYEGTPTELKHKILTIIDVSNLTRAKKVKIWRKLYGYKQKVGKKIYSSKGLVEKRFGRGVFLLEKEKSQTVFLYLRRNKTRYYFFDVWLE